MRLFLLFLLLTLFGCTDDPAPILFGEGSEAEYAAMTHLRERAEDGDVDAAAQLVFLTHWRAKDYAAALPELELLAEQGSVVAARLLVITYQHGRGVEPNYEEAARWLARAAELGDERAARDLEAYKTFRATVRT